MLFPFHWKISAHTIRRIMCMIKSMDVNPAFREEKWHAKLYYKYDIGIINTTFKLKGRAMVISSWLSKSYSFFLPSFFLASTKTYLQGRGMKKKSPIFLQSVDGSSYLCQIFLFPANLGQTKSLCVSTRKYNKEKSTWDTFWSQYLKEQGLSEKQNKV